MIISSDIQSPNICWAPAPTVYIPDTVLDSRDSAKWKTLPRWHFFEEAELEIWNEYKTILAGDQGYKTIELVTWDREWKR